MVMRYVPTADMNQYTQSEALSLESILRVSEDILDRQAYQEMQRILLVRRHSGFRDENLPSIIEAEEIWRSLDEIGDDLILSRINDQINACSLHAQERIRAWMLRNKQLVPKWDIRQVLALQDHPNADDTHGTIKILYFYSADNKPEYINLTY